MTKTFHDDPLDDLLSGKVPIHTVSTPKQPPASYTPQDFTEPCSKCHGSGKFRSYYGRVIGDCFTCKGKGVKTFRSSPEHRERAKANTAARRERDRAENATLFQTAHANEYAWLLSQSQRGDTFAISLMNGLMQYGSLTEKQMDAVRRSIVRDAYRAERVMVAAPAVATAGVDRLKAAFDAAAAYTASKAKGLTVRSPKITVGGITISPAKASGKNPGALYVKSGETYLGKIADGKFIASRECTPEQSTRVLAFVANPAEAAKVYGQETGVCCICNATLRSEWRLRGIGPICAEKFGW